MILQSSIPLWLRSAGPPDEDADGSDIHEMILPL
jgi:hypothetical protein